MPKKKVSKSPKQKDLLSAHPHLKWLLPIFAVLAVGFILVMKHRAYDDDNGMDRSYMMKQEIKDKVMMDSDTEEMDDEITPAPTYSY